MFAATLTTERLVLRPPRVEDAPANFERYTSDPEATRYLSWRTNNSVEEAVQFLRSITDPESASGDRHWAICFEGDSDPCGMVTVFGAGPIVGLGYVLQRSLWGRGMMTEALRRRRRGGVA